MRELGKNIRLRVKKYLEVLKKIESVKNGFLYTLPVGNEGNVF